jgi:hypothetical protein
MMKKATKTINGREYTAYIEVVREENPIKAEAARRELSAYGARLATELARREKEGKPA